MRDLGAVAARILARFAERLAAMDVDLPERQYVAPGSQVPWDGEQFVVHLMQLESGHPGSPTAIPGLPRAANIAVQFGVALVREVPALTGEVPLGEMIPDAAALGAAGAALIADASALMQVAIEIGEGYEIVDPGMGWLVGPAVTLGPEGGLAASRILLTMSVS